MNLRIYGVDIARKIQKWFLDLENIVLQNTPSSRKVKPEYQIVNSIESFKIIRPSNDNKYKREWVATWHSNNSLIIGKTRFKDDEHDYIQHFSIVSNTDSSTSSQHNLEVQKCTGCILHELSSLH